MERLRLRDLRALLEFVQESYALHDLDGFIHDVIRKLPTLVPSDITSYKEIDTARRVCRTWMDPAGLNTEERGRTFTRLMEEHPVFAHQRRTRDGHAFKTSDFWTRTQLLQSSLYNELYRPMGFQEQMGVLLTVRQPLSIGISVRRTRPTFSERDRLLLNVLRPHLVQAYQNAEAFTLLNQAAARRGEITVFLTADFGITYLPPQARCVMDDYFGTSPRSPERLPDALERWVKYQVASLEKVDDVPPHREPFIVTRDGRRLLVRLLSGPAQHLLVFSEEVRSPDPVQLEQLGLTRRQAEVLTWVAQGKTNDEIAMILGLSPRTVAKQLELMYPKLGVENRTAAAAVALAVRQPVDRI